MPVALQLGQLQVGRQAGHGSLGFRAPAPAPRTVRSPRQATKRHGAGVQVIGLRFAALPTLVVHRSHWWGVRAAACTGMQGTAVQCWDMP